MPFGCAEGKAAGLTGGTGAERGGEKWCACLCGFRRQSSEVSVRLSRLSGSKGETRWNFQTFSRNASLSAPAAPRSTCLPIKSLPLAGKLYQGTPSHYDGRPAAGSQRAAPAHNHPAKGHPATTAPPHGGYRSLWLHSLSMERAFVKIIGANNRFS